MIYYESIFQLINEAKKNDGFVTIYDVFEDTNVTNAKMAKNVILDFFEHTLNLSWMTLPFFHGKQDSITQKQRELLKYLDVEYSKNSVTFNLYKFFKIKDEDQTIETLELYEAFFNDCKSYVVKKFPKNKIQFLNESRPIRLEVGNIEDDNRLKEKITEYIKDEKMADWFTYLASGLNKLGPYSWFFISTKGLINVDEELDLMEKWRKERKTDE